MSDSELPFTPTAHRAIGVYDGGISSSAVGVARRRLRERATETDSIERLFRLRDLTKEMTVGRQS